MKQQAQESNSELREKLDLFISKWKLILVCVILAFILAFLYLRYATYEYQATASIKINNDKNSSKLPEISSLETYGLFSSDFSNITDEMEVIKSRTLLRKVVEELDLNIKYIVRGRIKEVEDYLNPPISINFLANDSIINKIDTTLYVKILTPTKFSLTSTESNELLNLEADDARVYAFGDKIKTGFGNIIFTPNIEKDSVKVGASIKVVMSSVDRVVEGYQAKINVSNNIGSDIISISVNENLKDKASLILDKIIEKYNEDVINDKQLIVQATSDFISNRLQLVSKELEEVDFTAETLQKSNRLTALASQSNIFLESERENETKLINTANQIQLIDYVKEQITSNNKESDILPADIGIADNSVSQLTKSHNELVLQRDRILKNSSEKNPTVINLNNQINALKSSLVSSLDNMRSTSKITLDALSQEDERIRGQIYSAPGKERQFRDIKRQQDIKESLYLYLLQKREETAIQLGLSSPNAKIIDKAYTSAIPISPKRLFVYLAALIFGIMIPSMFIYLSSILDTKIHNKNDLAKVLTIPFLGDIPKSDPKRRLIKKVDYSPKAEAFRIIRSNIDFILKGNKKKCKTLFVTSTKAQEGKSHTSINLASSLAYSEKRVLLIETDIRVPKVNEYLEIKADKGLTDYISDPDLTIDDVTTSVSNNKFLKIIPSGTIPPNPAELLMNDRVSTLFDVAQDDYDYIVVDTAAVGLVTDTLLISNYADLFIYVVSANNVDKRQLHIAQTLYDENRLPHMTILLNGTNDKSRGYGYGYGNNPHKKKKKWWQFYKK